MKKLLLITILVLSLLPTNKVQAQSNGVGIAVGAVLAAGAIIAEIELIKEQLELGATEWALGNTDLSYFELKTLGFDGLKMKDMSNLAVVGFRVQDAVTNKRYVLLCFTSRGWLNDYGVDFSLVKWKLIDTEEWLNLMQFYIGIAGDVEVDKKTLRTYKIVNKGVKQGSTTIIKFEGIKGDVYKVGDYSDEFKLVYNERSLGLYLKETGNLAQIKRRAIILSHNFLMGFVDEEEFKKSSGRR